MEVRHVADHDRLHAVLQEGEERSHVPLDQLGPAVNSGKALFLYGAPGNGKTVVAQGIGSALGTETGGNASSTAVRALIKQLVAAEDAAKPLSDSQLSQMLEEQGIQVARRTVAKYREALKIAPAQMRKAM